MKPELIFVPMLALVFWTFVIMFYMAWKRIGAGFAGRVKFGYFTVGESDKVPDDVRLAGRNFSNLFEMPVLFYALCIALYVTRDATEVLWVLAWIYVALRVGHSLIHVSYNKIMHRFACYAISNLILLAMWILFAVRVLHQP
jgi:hypothetical protein